MTARRIAARSAAVVVALVAGAASYQHIAAVALSAGEPDWVAYTLPLAIDGLIVVGVMALLEDKAAGLLPRRSAWLAVVVGVVATLAANVASAEPTATARLVAAAAPVAFLISVEVLTRSGRPASSSGGSLSPAPATRGVAVGAGVGVGAADDTRGDSVTSAVGQNPTVGKPVTSENAAKSTETAQNRPTPTRTPRRRVSTAERVARAVDRSPNATNAELAARLGLSERTIQRYRREMVTTANGSTGPIEVVSHADD